MSLHRVGIYPSTTPGIWIAKPGREHIDKTETVKKIEWTVMAKGRHTLDIVPPARLISDLNIQGKVATANVQPDAAPGPYNYSAWVDGQPVVQAAPGINIDVNAVSVQATGLSENVTPSSAPGMIIDSQGHVDPNSAPGIIIG